MPIFKFQTNFNKQYYTYETIEQGILAPSHLKKKQKTDFFPVQNGHHSLTQTKQKV